jgi:hypothetical protein
LGDVAGNLLKLTIDYSESRNSSLVALPKPQLMLNLKNKSLQEPFSLQLPDGEAVIK